MSHQIKKVDVIIIGAGIVGCSIAFALGKRGFRTLNLDSLPAAGYGSTSHSSAIIRPIYSHTTSCAIAHESRSIWQHWPEFLGCDDERGYATYTECGGLVLVKEGQQQLNQASLDAMKTVGVDYQLLDADALRDRYPGICLDSFGPPKKMSDKRFGQATTGKISLGILVSAAGYVSDPQLATHNLQVAAENKGARFQFNARVIEVLRSSSGISGIRVQYQQKDTIDEFEISAHIVINASGPHSSVINELAGINSSLKIRTQPQRHEVVYLPAPDKHFSKGAQFLIDADTGVYQRPDGADMLIGSADPECDPPVVVDPDNYNASFTEQWTLQAYRAAQRFPEFGIPNTARGTVGIYDVSDDWIPIYDKTDLPGFYLAIGTSGNQFKNAPLIGEMLAQIIQVEKDGLNHDINPAKLELKFLRRHVSLDFYSRNRTLQKTRSVMA